MAAAAGKTLKRSVLELEAIPLLFLKMLISIKQLKWAIKVE
jgi:hypothetical protein